MYIAYNNSSKKIIAIRETEWQCRMNAKDIDLVDYNTWVASITDSNGIVTYPSESFTIVESNESLSYQGKDSEGKNVTISYVESGHIPTTTEPGYKPEFHLKWDASKKEIVKDDTAKVAWELAQEWKQIRRQRTRLLAETDWVVIKARENGGQVPAAWKTYRVALRDIPSEQSSKTKYSEITWPTRPE